MPLRQTKSRTVLLVASLGLTACSSLQPPPYTEQESRDRIVQDRSTMYADQEPVKGPLTFYQAAARALKYNLDYRLKLMESALAARLQDVSSYELLPRLVASAGFVGRSNESGGTSVGIEDGQVSLRPSTSEERYRQLYGLGFSWSLLDFGMAYYRAQQKSDQVLMADERRRRVVQNLLQDVRDAYWRAVSAQRLKPEVDALLARSERALKAAREAETKGLMPRQEVLAYQRALLDSIYLLTVRRQDLEFAQAELTALVSLPPGSQLVLAEVEQPSLPQLTGNIDHLEQLTLENRPEIMEEWLRKRVNLNDLKIAKAQLWPNVTVSAGYEYDSNKYLYNNDWLNSSVQVSMNLLRLLQYPALQATEEAQGRTDDIRRVALSMAILTQVRVGGLRYRLARQEVAFAEESMRVDRSLLDYARSAKQTTIGSELEVIRAEGRYLLSRYQREAAYSRAQGAWGRLYNTVGLSVMPSAIHKNDIETLSREIEMTMNSMEAQHLLVSTAEALGGETAR